MFDLKRVGLLVLALQAAAWGQLEKVDLPKVDNIAIDADAKDWGDRGYVIDALTFTSRERPKTDDFDARARIGWSEKGLLVFVSVTDESPQEGKTLEALRSRDSVEVVIVDRRNGVDSAQFVIAPGGSKQSDKPRQRITDRRAKDAARPPATLEIASRRTATGYEMELLIPWAPLADGADLGLQLSVNDADGEERANKLAWFPIDEPIWDTSLVQPVRLAEKPSPTPKAAVTVRDDRMRRLMLQVATRDAKAQLVQVFDGQRFIAEAPMTSLGELNSATAFVPLPQLSSPSATWTVKVDGVEVARVAVPSFDKQRIASAEELSLKFRSYIFSGDAFPGCGFENSERAEILLSDYTIKRRFFDAEFNEVAKPTKPGRYGAVVDIVAAGAEPIRRYVTLYKSPQPFDEANWRPKMHIPLPPEFGLGAEAADSREVAALVRGSWGDGPFDKELAAVIVAGMAEGMGKDTSAPADSVWNRNNRWWHTLREKIGQPLIYPYLTWLPKGAEDAKDRKFPAILFLHGSGERGRDLKMVETAGPRGYAKAHPDFPFIVISPLCPNGEWWNPLACGDLLKEVMAKYPIDPDRLYITGLSMGGFGTWDLTTLFPTRFAASVPICGGGDFERVSGLAELPTWVVHGGKDTSVSPVYAYRFVENLRKVNGRVKFTLYPDLGHNVWTPTYNDPRLYEWLLEQKRGEPKEPKSAAPGTQPTETR